MTPIDPTVPDSIPGVIPAKAGSQLGPAQRVGRNWIPAFAGMTGIFGGVR